MRLPTTTISTTTQTGSTLTAPTVTSSITSSNTSTSKSAPIFTFGATSSAIHGSTPMSSASTTFSSSGAPPSIVIPPFSFGTTPITTATSSPSMTPKSTSSGATAQPTQLVQPVALQSAQQTTQQITLMAQSALAALSAQLSAQQSTQQSAQSAQKDQKEQKKATTAAPEPISHKSPLHRLVQYAIDQYYKKPYPKPVAGPIPRPSHGALHICCALFLVDLIFDLIKTHLPKPEWEKLLSDPETKKPFTEDDIKLIKLAMAYHDVANISEETFYDEAKHAEIFQRDALKLGFPKQQVDKLAYAIKFKDSKEAKDLNNIYKILIHDADCFEFIRCLLKEYPERDNTCGILSTRYEKSLDLQDLITTLYPDVANFRIVELNILQYFKNKLSAAAYDKVVIDILKCVLVHRKNLLLLYSSHNHSFIEFHSNSLFATYCLIKTNSLVRQLTTIDIPQLYHFIEICEPSRVFNKVSALDWYIRDDLVQKILDHKVPKTEKDFEMVQENDDILAEYRENGVYIRRIVRQEDKKFVSAVTDEFKQLAVNEKALQKWVPLKNYKAEGGYKHSPCTWVADKYPIETYCPGNAGYIAEPIRIHGFFKKNVLSNSISTETFMGPDCRTITGRAKDLKSKTRFREKMREWELRRQGAIYDPYQCKVGQTKHERNELLAEMKPSGVKAVVIDYDNLNKNAIHDALCIAIYCKAFGTKGKTPRFYSYSSLSGLKLLSTQQVDFLFTTDDTAIRDESVEYNDTKWDHFYSENKVECLTITIANYLNDPKSTPLFITCSLTTGAPSQHNGICYHSYIVKESKEENKFTQVLSYYHEGNLVCKIDDKLYYDHVCSYFIKTNDFYDSHNIVVINVLLNLLAEIINERFNFANVSLSQKTIVNTRKKYLDLVFEPIILSPLEDAKTVKAKFPREHHTKGQWYDLANAVPMGTRELLSFIGYDDDNYQESHLENDPTRFHIKLAISQKMDAMINKLLSVLEECIAQDTETFIKKNPDILFQNIEHVNRTLFFVLLQRKKIDLLEMLFPLVIAKKSENYFYNMLAILQTVNNSDPTAEYLPLALLVRLFEMKFKQACLQNDIGTINTLIQRGFNNLPEIKIKAFPHPVKITPILEFFEIMNHCKKIQRIYGPAESTRILNTLIAKALKDPENHINVILNRFKNIVNPTLVDKNGDSLITILASSSLNEKIVKCIINILKNCNIEIPLNQLAILLNAWVNAKRDPQELFQSKMAPELSKLLEQRYKLGIITDKKDDKESKDEKKSNGKSKNEEQSKTALMRITDAKKIAIFELVKPIVKKIELLDVLSSPNIVHRVIGFLTPAERKIFFKTCHKLDYSDVSLVGVTVISRFIVEDFSAISPNRFQTFYIEVLNELRQEALPKVMQIVQEGRNIKEQVFEIYILMLDTIIQYLIRAKNDFAINPFSFMEIFRLLVNKELFLLFLPDDRQRIDDLIFKPYFYNLSEYFIHKASINEMAQLLTIKMIPPSALDAALQTPLNSYIVKHNIKDQTDTLKKMYLLIISGADVNQKISFNVHKTSMVPIKLPLIWFTLLWMNTSIHKDLTLIKLILERSASIEVEDNFKHFFSDMNFFSCVENSFEAKALDELIEFIIKKQLDPKCRWHASLSTYLAAYKDKVFSKIMELSKVDAQGQGLSLLKCIADEKQNSILSSMLKVQTNVLPNVKANVTKSKKKKNKKNKAVSQTSLIDQLKVEIARRDSISSSGSGAPVSTVPSVPGKRISPLDGKKPSEHDDDKIMADVKTSMGLASSWANQFSIWKSSLSLDHLCKPRHDSSKDIYSLNKIIDKLQTMPWENISDNPFVSYKKVVIPRPANGGYARPNENDKRFKDKSQEYIKAYFKAYDENAIKTYGDFIALIFQAGLSMMSDPVQESFSITKSIQSDSPGIYLFCYNQNNLDGFSKSFPVAIKAYLSTHLLKWDTCEANVLPELIAKSIPKFVIVHKVMSKRPELDLEILNFIATKYGLLLPKDKPLSSLQTKQIRISQNPDGSIYIYGLKTELDKFKRFIEKEFTLTSVQKEMKDKEKGLQKDWRSIELPIISSKLYMVIDEIYAKRDPENETVVSKMKQLFGPAAKFTASEIAEIRKRVTLLHDHQLTMISYLQSTEFFKSIVPINITTGLRSNFISPSISSKDQRSKVMIEAMKRLGIVDDEKEARSLLEEAAKQKDFKETFIQLG